MSQSLCNTRDISVITCIFDQCRPHFAECAASVAALCADIEWLIADDGSSAEAAASYREIVGAVAGNVPVQFISLPQRSGLSRARNAALEKARGQWVVVLDSDDRLALNIETMLMGLPSVIGLVAVEAKYFSELRSEHRRIGCFQRLFEVYGRTILDPFLWFDFYYHGIIARRDVLCHLGGFREDLKVGEDQDILLRAVEFLRINQVSFIHEVGYEYRDNPAGVCHRDWKAVENNYTATMLASARRRGAGFQDCRFAGAIAIDGAQVDRYEYKSSSGEWLPWQRARALYGEKKGMPNGF